MVVMQRWASGVYTFQVHVTIMDRSQNARIGSMEDRQAQDKPLQPLQVVWPV